MHFSNGESNQYDKPHSRQSCTDLFIPDKNTSNVGKSEGKWCFVAENLLYPNRFSCIYCWFQGNKKWHDLQSIPYSILNLRSSKKVFPLNFYCVHSHNLTNIFRKKGFPILHSKYYFTLCPSLWASFPSSLSR